MRMFLAAVFSTLALPVWAETNRGDAVFDVLRLDEIIAVMRQEGLGYGDQLAADLFPGRGTAEWDETVDRIYDLGLMEDRVRADLDAAFDGVDVTPIVDFFSTELGQTIVTLEISAREALLDEAIEEMSIDSAAIAVADETEAYLLVRDFIEANDLIETNVVGALNSNYAFYTGLVDGNAFDFTLTQEEILADVWGQEAEIRSSTTEWLYSFLLLAYQPLSAEDLQTYITFSKSDAGQALNRALFAGFDGMFDDISRALGLASARYMGGEEL